MFRIRIIFKMLCQHVIFPLIYFVNRIRPVDKKLIILADSHHDQCPEHVFSIFTLWANGKHLREWLALWLNIQLQGQW